MQTRRTPIPVFAILAGAAAVAAAPAGAQAATDSAGIRQAALDYIEGWYTADGTRMSGALHPELVKRLHVVDPESGQALVDGQGKTRLVAATRAGGGSSTAEADRRADVTILDIFRGAAVVRVDAHDWVDYLQLVKEEDRWLILNVLWELRRPPGSGEGG
jgi:hypothetical protein